MSATERRPRRVAFLSMKSGTSFKCFDSLCVAPLRENHNWECDDRVPWDRDFDLQAQHSAADAIPFDEAFWSAYDAVVVRSTWNYHSHTLKFAQMLQKLDRVTTLFNPLDTMLWNMSKRYFVDLANDGVPIIPSIIVDDPAQHTFVAFGVTGEAHTPSLGVRGVAKYDPATISRDQSIDDAGGALHVSAAIDAAFERFQVDELVIKPLVSAGSDFTYRISRESLSGPAPLHTRLEDLLKSAAEENAASTLQEETFDEKLRRVFRNKPFILQPFVRRIADEGELSLLFFAGDLSCAVKKIPANGEFKVQEDYGGQHALVDCESVPPEALRVARAAIAATPNPTRLLYARADLVPGDAGQYLVMELELIEPSLYFHKVPGSAARFASAFATLAK